MFEKFIMCQNLTSRQVGNLNRNKTSRQMSSIDMERNLFWRSRGGCLHLESCERFACVDMLKEEFCQHKLSGNKGSSGDDIDRHVFVLKILKSWLVTVVTFRQIFNGNANFAIRHQLKSFRPFTLTSHYSLLPPRRFSPSFFSLQKTKQTK